MPRLSLWKPTKGNDFKFMDNRIREMFVIGGTGINIHKYMGPVNQGDLKKADQPMHTNSSVTNIQDLLFLENRDRKYEKDVTFRGFRHRTPHGRTGEKFDKKAKVVPINESKLNSDVKDKVEEKYDPTTLINWENTSSDGDRFEKQEANLLGKQIFKFFLLLKKNDL